jgi:hypothetical protein
MTENEKQYRPAITNWIIQNLDSLTYEELLQMSDHIEDCINEKLYKDYI